MKRYEKYKDSGVEWLGEIPEHWTFERMKHIGQVTFSSVDRHELVTEKSVKVCHYPVAYKNESVDTNTEFPMGTCSESEYANFQLLKGDIILTKDSETANDIGVPCFVKETIENCVCGYHLAQLRVIETKHINGEYLFRYFQTKNVSSYFETSCNGVTRFGLGKPIIENMLLLKPTLHEQQIIARYLDDTTSTIDFLIKEKSALITKLQEKRKALINEVVTKGINPNAPMRDSGIEWLGMIPEHWKCFNFRYIIDILTDFTANGSFGDLAKNVTYLEEGYSRLVRLTDLRENLNNKGIYVSKKSHEYLSKSSLYGDEILLANVGAYAGLACLMPKIDYPATLGPNMFLLKFNARVNNKFIYYALLSSYLSEQLINKAISSAQPKLNKEDVRSCIVILPTLSDQAQIVEFIESRTTKIEQTILEIQIQIQKLKEYKTAVISEVVTGKVDVREWKPKNN